MKMFKIFTVIGMLLMFISCAMQNSKPSAYTLENYPDSYLVKMSENTGVSLEVVAQNIWSIIETEIILGKFTKQEVSDFIETNKKYITPEFTYVALNEFVSTYFLKLAKNDNEMISQAVVIAYVVVKNSIDIPVLESGLLPQDINILDNFVVYLEQNLNKMP